MDQTRPQMDVFPTRGLGQFIAALSSRSAPLIVDLGPALGPTVAFLGERLGCKLQIEDLLTCDSDWLARPEDEAAKEADDVAPARKRTLAIASESVDGVLCWDVFDYLDRECGPVLAAEIMRVLKPGGVVFVCHRADSCSVVGRVVYEVVDERTLRYRIRDQASLSPRVWPSREMRRMFDRLQVAGSFLLTNQMREIVLKRTNRIEFDGVGAKEAPAWHARPLHY